MTGVTGAPATAITSIPGATLGVASAVIVVPVIPPPLGSAAAIPPPPLSFSAAVNVTVPITPGASITQQKVQAALSTVQAAAATAQTTQMGATPPSVVVADIQVSAQFVVSGAGASLSAAQLAAAKSAFAVSVGVFLWQAALTPLAASPAPNTVALAATVSGLGTVSAIAAGMSQTVASNSTLAALQAAVASLAASPSAVRVSLPSSAGGYYASTASVVLTVFAGATSQAAANAASAALYQALIAGGLQAQLSQPLSPPAFVSPANVVGINVPPALAPVAPPPPMSATVAVTVTVPFIPASSISPSAVSSLLAVLAGMAPLSSGSAGITPATVSLTDIVVSASIAVSAASPPTQPQLVSAAQVIADSLVLDVSQIALSVSGAPPSQVVGVVVTGVGNNAVIAAAIARALAADRLLANITQALQRAGMRNPRTAPIGGTSAATVIVVRVGITDGGSADDATAALQDAFGLARLRAALLAAGLPADGLVSSPATTTLAQPPPPPRSPPSPPRAPPTPDAAASLSAADLLALLMAIADDLANSLLDSLLPGESASVIFSKFLQLAVQVDRTPSPRLTTANVTAPLSAAAFYPLPAEALASVSDGAIVRTAFISAAFDFHTNELQPGQAPSEAGVVRYVVAGADKVPLPVSNLSQPITFELGSPPVTSPEGDKAACTFWYERTTAMEVCRLPWRRAPSPRPPLFLRLFLLLRGCCACWRRRVVTIVLCWRLRLPSSCRDTVRKAYVTDGCAALPNPVPPGLTVSWPTPFPTVTTNSNLSSAWVVSGSLMCNATQLSGVHSDAGCCTLRVLNCTAPGVKMWPDEMHPITVQPIQCPPGAPPDTQLVVFGGNGCPLVTPDPAGCWWNATAQVFAGSACRQTPKTYCACRRVIALLECPAWVRTTLRLCILSDRSYTMPNNARPQASHRLRRRTCTDHQGRKHRADDFSQPCRHRYKAQGAEEARVLLVPRSACSR